MTAYRASANAYYSAATQTKTIVVPSSTVVGDSIFLSFAGSQTLPDSVPAGFGVVQQGNGGTCFLALYVKVATASDPGSTVTVTAATNAKTGLAVTVYSGTSTANPVAASAFRAETSTTATATHPGSALTLPTGFSGYVARFLGVKDAGTPTNPLPSSSTYGPPAGATLRTNSVTSATQTAAAVAAAADTAGNVAAYTAGVWTVDQASVNAAAIDVALAGVSTVTILRPTTDITVGGWTSTGTTLASVLGDDDPASYATSPVGGGTENDGDYALGGWVGTVSMSGLALPGTSSMNLRHELVQGSASTVLGTVTALETANTEHRYDLSAVTTAERAKFTMPGTFSLRRVVATT